MDNKIVYYQVENFKDWLREHDYNNSNIVIIENNEKKQ